jgi:alkaline phosphatase
MDVTFGSGGHSGIFVPIYSKGPLSWKLGGVVHTTDVFEVMKEALNP